MLEWVPHRFDTSFKPPLNVIRGNLVVSLSTSSQLHPTLGYGGLSTIKAFFPTSDIDSGPNTFRPEALVQRISTAGHRERYSMRQDTLS